MTSATSMPIERAVPSMIFIACSTVFALRSGIFIVGDLAHLARA